MALSLSDLVSLGEVACFEYRLKAHILNLLRKNLTKLKTDRKRTKKGNVLFLRGVNTQGNDFLGTGPLRLSYSARLAREFQKYGYELVDVKGIGAHTLEESADIILKLCKESIFNLRKSQRSIQDTPLPLFAIGHSAGGVLCRVLAQSELQEEFSGFVSISSPHLGSPYAAINEVIPQRMRATLKVLGYDVAEHSKVLKSYSADSLQRFNQSTLFNVQVPHASIVTSDPASVWPRWLYQVVSQIVSEEDSFFKKPLFRPSPKNVNQINPHLNPSNYVHWGDGLIQVESQIWGDVLGHFKLDHASSLGIPSLPTVRGIAQQKKEFRRSVKCMAEWMTRQLANRKN